MPLFLRESEVDRLLAPSDVIAAVERAEQARCAGLAFVNPRQRMRVAGGVLHLMAAAWPAEGVLGYKAYTSFGRLTAPLFLVHLFDAATGRPLAVLQANRLGQLRTGAATAVAARFLARTGSPLDRYRKEGVLDGSGPVEIGIIGAGYQAFGQIEALCADQPVAGLRVYSRDATHREDFARTWSGRGISARAVGSAREAVEGADIVITCTTSREPVLDGAWLKPGAFVAGVGANSLLRRELDPATLKRSARIVVDSFEQAKLEAAAIQFGVESGSLHRENIHELAAVVGGRVIGRTNSEEITIFHSMGSALWDVAAALTAVTHAREKGVGQELPLDDAA